jgi:hypothetical protein
MASFEPTPQQIKEVFDNSMMYEILYTFGVPSHHPADYAQWEFINFSRLAHARVLYGFLQTPKSSRYRDDVLAEDFGYPAQPGILLPSDKERLDKDLMHFSYSRLRHTPVTKPWPPTILANLLDPAVAFMRFIRDERQDLFSNAAEAHFWSELINALCSGRQLQLWSFTLANAMTRIFTLGEPLPGGKPAVTTTFEITAG